MDHTPENIRIRAIDQMDAEGSLVRSGMKLAESVLGHLESGDQVEINLEGVKGASSSYFNVFLRRIEEGCGIGVFERQCKMVFSSNIQRMVYERSYESLKKGGPKSNETVDPAVPHQSVISRLIHAIMSLGK